MFSFHDYKDLVESGSYNDAFSIIKSLVHNKNNNIKNLYEYVFVFQNLIETTPFDDIKEQINDFKKCVENYKTNVRLDKIKLSKLKEIEKKIFEYQTIYKNKSERLISEKEDSVKRQNTEILEILSTILTQLDDIQTEDDFNKLDMSIRGELPEGYFKQITLIFNPWSALSWLKARFFDITDVNIKQFLLAII